MKTKKTSKSAIITLVVAAAMIAILTPLTARAELDQVEESAKKWETGIGVGYVNYDWKDAQNTAYIDLRIMRRLAYPFLVGPGFTFSATGNILYFEGNLPLITRISTGPLKADIVIRPGVAYAQNTDLDVSKVIGVGTLGLELKKFVTKGTSIGIGAYYSATTYSKLNSFKVGLIVGF